MLRSISRVSRPPSVSMPSDSGVTSSSCTSRLAGQQELRSLDGRPDRHDLIGVDALVAFLAEDVLDQPLHLAACASCRRPARSRRCRRASSWRPARPCSTGPRQRSIRRSTSCSNLARVSDICRCFGPEASAVMNGRLMSVVLACDRSFLARSAASFRRCKAIWSLRRSMPFSFLNSSAIQSISTWSKSSPPRCVSPLTPSTSKTPSPTSRIEMSKVPPPRSKTAIVSLFFLSRP